MERRGTNNSLTVHRLKTDPDVFQASWLWKKKYEIRFNDRNFQANDLVELKETKFAGVEMADVNDPKPLVYTGRIITANIDSVLPGPRFGLKEGWVALSLS